MSALTQVEDSGARWEHFPHGADIGIRGIGPSQAQAFEQTALALTAVLTDPSLVLPRRRIAIHCEAAGPEALLVQWLNSLVYEMAVRRMIFGRFEVHLAGSALDAEAWGEQVDVPRHQPAVEVKGATYTSLFVGRSPNGAWVAQCVVDV